MLKNLSAVLIHGSNAGSAQQNVLFLLQASETEVRGATHLGIGINHSLSSHCAALLAVACSGWEFGCVLLNDLQLDVM